MRDMRQLTTDELGAVSGGMFGCNPLGDTCPMPAGIRGALAGAAGSVEPPIVLHPPTGGGGKGSGNGISLF